jgi:hypothetical protein
MDQGPMMPIICFHGHDEAGPGIDGWAMGENVGEVQRSTALTPPFPPRHLTYLRMYTCRNRWAAIASRERVASREEDATVEIVVVD